jgi:hypothetical protein
MDSTTATDLAAITCGATLGSGNLVGSVHGKPLQVSHAWGGKVLTSPLAYYVLFVNQSGTCPLLADLDLIQFGVVICNTKPGTYVVGQLCTDAGLAVPTSIQIPMPVTNLKATSGAVVVEDLDLGCGGKVKGSFTADFAGEKVTGTFDTVNCLP